MSLLYILVAAAIGLISIAFILTGPRSGVAIGAVAIAGLFLAFQQAAGLPAAPDGRLSGEQWRGGAGSAPGGGCLLCFSPHNSGEVRRCPMHIVVADQGAGVLEG